MESAEILLDYVLGVLRNGESIYSIYTTLLVELGTVKALSEEPWYTVDSAIKIMLGEKSDAE